MKSKATGEITIVVELERGEWTMRANQWSIASVSFTVRRRSDGKWGVRINHSDFKAYERRWTVKDRVAFASVKKFPGFYPRREDLPGAVVMALASAYEEWTAHFATVLPAIDEGKWSES